jgi:hypothetical protein
MTRKGKRRNQALEDQCHDERQQSREAAQRRAGFQFWRKHTWRANLARHFIKVQGLMPLTGLESSNPISRWSP